MQKHGPSLGRSHPTPPSPPLEMSTPAPQTKSGLSCYLSLSVKHIQENYVCCDSAIHSNDKANNLCHAIEAIFLHGLKDSFTKKISGYWSKKVLAPSFWQMLVKFSHKDIVNQLSHQKQVTSEVGQCRAWIRLALNDGLMSSYLEAMITDRKAMRYFYLDSAYLMDCEQPLIMINLIKGVEELYFQLAYNSSALNMWTKTPLILAGHLIQNDPIKPSSRGQSVNHPNVDEWSIITDNECISVAKPSPQQQQGCQPSPVEEITHETPPQEILSSQIIPENSPTGIIPENSPTGIIPENSPTGIMPENSPTEIIPENSPAGIITENSPTGIIPEITPVKSATEISSEIFHEKPFPEESPEITSEIAFPEIIPDKPLEILPAESNVIEEGVTVSEPSPQRPESPSPIGRIEPPVLNIAPITDGSQREISVEEVSSPVCLQTLDIQDGVVSIENIFPTVIEGTSSPSIIHEHSPEYQNSPGYDWTSHGVWGDVIDSQSGQLNSDHAESDYDSTEFGNRLMINSGWSTDFHLKNNQHNYLSISTSDDDDDDFERKETFSSMLDKYGPDGSVTLGAVIGGLSEDPGDTPLGSHDTLTSPGGQDGDNQSQKTEDRFEVIPLSLSGSVNLDEDPGRKGPLEQLVKLSTEKGLDSQNYQCRLCSRPIGMIYGKPKLCRYDSAYYCNECHIDDESIIPARVVNNWDFSKYPVCKQNKRLIDQICDQPIINIDRYNPELYCVVPELDGVRNLRVQLRSLCVYLSTCSKSVSEELTNRVWPREYLMESVHVYSINDLVQVNNRQLTNSLQRVVKFARKHISHCSLCSQKGFYCEICNSSKIIYPFNTDNTLRCDGCKALFHNKCKTSNIKCPKCVRRNVRQSQYNNIRHT